jgi:outer membrane lipase/esterase
MKHVILATALAFGLGASAQAASLSDDYSSFWVLGDSLSDTGNLPPGFAPPPPYFDSRFSNGEVWADDLAADFAIQGNFAFGGARTVGGDAPDLLTQLGIFGASALPALGDKPLVSMWFGANDLFNTIPFGTGEATGIDAANNIKDAAEALANAGVRDLLIMNLPSLDLTPSYAAFQPALAEAAKEATAAFNKQLKSNIAEIKATGVTVIDVNMDAFFKSVLADPASFGIANTALPCLFPSQAIADAFGQPLLCDPSVASASLFFDSVHPTTFAHAQIADRIRASIAAVPLPATAPMLLLALGGIGFVARRKAA